MRAEMRDCPICSLSCKVRGGGYTHHMKWHERQGDISHKDFDIGRKNVIIREVEVSLFDMLQPLLTRGAVAIEVDGPRMLKKQRIGKHVLFITMGSLYGDPRGIVFGLAGQGCEIQRIQELKLTPLLRIGLQADTAKEIISQLRRLLNVNDVDVERKNA